MLHGTKYGKQAVTDPHDTVTAILGWLASEPELLSRFLALSGLQPAMLRQAVDDPGFLAGLTDFLMSHEPDLLAFCQATDHQPEDVQAAWTKFSGPGLGSGEY